MNRSVFSRIELVFWNWTIKVLSQPGLPRSFMRRAVPLLRDSELTSFGIFLGISAVVGLVSGYLFFFVASSFR